MMKKDFSNVIFGVNKMISGVAGFVKTPTLNSQEFISPFQEVFTWELKIRRKKRRWQNSAEEQSGLLSGLF